MDVLQEIKELEEFKKVLNNLHPLGYFSDPEKDNMFWAWRERAKLDKQHEDVEADGIVFCGKCGQKR